MISILCELVVPRYEMHTDVKYSCFITLLVEERLHDVLLSFSNIAALIPGTLLLDWVRIW